MISLAFFGLNNFIIPGLGLLGLCLAFKRYLTLKNHDLSDSLKSQIILNLKIRKSNPAKINTDLEARLSAHPALGPIFAELKYPHLRKARSEAKAKIKNLGYTLADNSKYILVISIMTLIFCVLVAVLDADVFYEFYEKWNNKKTKYIDLLTSNRIPLLTLGFLVALVLTIVSHQLNQWCKNIINSMNEIFDATQI